MKQVFLAVNDGEKVAVEHRGSYWKKRFVLKNSGKYVLSGSSEEGVPVREGLEFPIEIINDTPPAIEWVWPKEDLDYSGKDLKHKIPLVYKVEDDYGIESVYLYAGAPGRATQSYEIDNLDGKERKYRQTYDFPIGSWKTVPVVRVYLMANDNHPGFQNQTPTSVRRFYLQPPGTFDESEEATDEAKLKTDPFELTALELYHLIKTQQAQNQTLDEKTGPDTNGEWVKQQVHLAQITAQTVLRVNGRIRKVRYGQVAAGGNVVGVPGVGSATPDQATGEAQAVSDLATRLEQVITRLSGSFERLDQLQPGAVPDQNSALDHQLRQLDAGKKDRRRRSREEGDRALRELEAAFKELTGKKPPRSADEAEAEKEKEDEKAKEDEDSEKKKEKDKTENENEEFDFGKSDNEIVKGLEGQQGDTGVGDKEKDKLGGASLPSNVYSPSQYTLDPDTVHLETPSSRLLRKTLAENLSGLDLSRYGTEPVPPEYKKAVSEYNKALLGED